MANWFKTANPRSEADELQALADCLLDGCTRESRIRTAMLLAQRDRHALWFLRPRLFDFIASVHGEQVAARRLATLDAWIEAKKLGMPAGRR